MSDFLGISGSLTSTFAPLINNVNVRWVGKHGSDSNNGLTIDNAFLTFSAAIASASSGDAIVCMDKGTYSEAITIPAGVSVYAPNATISGPSGGGYGAGTVSFSGDQSTAVFHMVISDGRTAVLKSASGNGGTNWIYVNKIIQTGSPGTGILNFDTGAVPAPAVIMAYVNSIFADKIGVGTSTEIGGHIHAHIGDIYLTADSAIGIANYGGSNIVGDVDHIVNQGGSHSSLIGVWHGVGGGQLNVNVRVINVGAGNTAYDALSGGTINMFLNYLQSGAVGSSGGTLNVSTP